MTGPSNPSNDIQPRPMRVLLATDGSECAEVARDLLAAISWPEGSTIRAVTAIENVGALFGMPWAVPSAPRVERYEEDLIGQAESILESAARGLARTGLDVERAVLRGRPGLAVALEATDWRADLVVAGSRGHGSIASMLLGSVSSEIVDNAHCPVLIGRSRSLNRVVLAHDGSNHAHAAERILAEWPIFAGSAIEVASVAQTPMGWYVGIGPQLSADAIEFYDQGVQESVREHRQIAEESAGRLADAGRRASSNVAEGDPATELIKLADERQADLVVIGTHGRTGIARLLLGSVARNVLTHASMSVLVVRPPVGSSRTTLDP
jgi:nucleotide-binding universal stress UspA family protein